jgi:hypothetical protein
MNAKIEKIKKRYVSELGKAGIVAVSTVGGLFLIHGIRKWTASHPKTDAIAKYAVPTVMILGGALVAAALDENNKFKYVGYGLATAGAVNVLNQSDTVKQYLSGISGETQIPAENAFYTESEQRQNLVNGLGLAALPVGNAVMQEYGSTELNLPEINGVEDEPALLGSDDPSLLGDDENEGLGYNGDATEDVDPLNGIL